MYIVLVPYCTFLLSNKFNHTGMYIRNTVENNTYVLVAVTSSGILKAKQKLGITFNSDKLGGIDFTKLSKLTMCSA